MARKTKREDRDNPVSQGKYMHPVSDPGQVVDESCLLNRIFVGKQDSEITFDYVMSNYPGPLCEIPKLMTDGAFLHFMSIIIQWCSLPRPEVDCLAESVLFRLHGDCQENRELVQAMTIEQRSVVVSFIKKEFRDESIHSWSYPKQVSVVLNCLGE